MKREYEAPEIAVITYEAGDVITTSGETGELPFVPVKPHSISGTIGE